MLRLEVQPVKVMRRVCTLTLMMALDAFLKPRVKLEDLLDITNLPAAPAALGRKAVSRQTRTRGTMWP